MKANPDQSQLPHTLYTHRYSPKHGAKNTQEAVERSTAVELPQPAVVRMSPIPSRRVHEYFNHVQRREFV